jgi:D-glycero-alpha-D-manno-heptose 1-phosphate guanylyltransferase
MINQCIILAGGLGTRLRAAVPDLPKCMAPVAGKPFLHYVIRHFQNQGVEQFIFSLGYMHEVILDYLHNNYYKTQVKAVLEKEPLGTGGAIRLACEVVQSEHVLVTNGDTFFRIDVKRLSAFHFERQSECTVCLKPMTNFDRFGAVELKKSNNAISNFREKQYYKKGLINGGVYALNVNQFMKKNWPQKFSFEKDYLEQFYTTDTIFGQAQDEYFIDIGIPEDYEKANVDFSTMRP